MIMDGRTHKQAENRMPSVATCQQRYKDSRSAAVLLQSFVIAYRLDFYASLNKTILYT